MSLIQHHHIRNLRKLRRRYLTTCESYRFERELRLLTQHRLDIEEKQSRRAMESLKEAAAKGLLEAKADLVLPPRLDLGFTADSVGLVRIQNIWLDAEHIRVAAEGLGMVRRS